MQTGDSARRLGGPACGDKHAPASAIDLRGIASGVAFQRVDGRRFGACFSRQPASAERSVGLSDRTRGSATQRRGWPVRGYTGLWSHEALVSDAVTRPAECRIGLTYATRMRLLLRRAPTRKRVSAERLVVPCCSREAGHTEPSRPARSCAREWLSRSAACIRNFSRARARRWFLCAHFCVSRRASVRPQRPHRTDRADALSSRVA
jgi:hypothetical protein